MIDGKRFDEDIIVIHTPMGTYDIVTSKFYQNLAKDPYVGLHVTTKTYKFS